MICRTATGETLRVQDWICWRHLEGRPCRTAQESKAADAIDVVIIPVLPSAKASLKRPADGGSGATPGGDATKPSGSNNAPPPTIVTPLTDATATTSDTASTNGTVAARQALLSACDAAHAALQAAGLRPTTDSDPRQTPGAKYNAYEHRGVALRVEVGSREVSSGSFCLALHPRLRHLHAVAADAARAAAQEGAGQGSAIDAAELQAGSAQPAGRNGLGGQRAGEGGLNAEGARDGSAQAQCRGDLGPTASVQGGVVQSSSTSGGGGGGGRAGKPSTRLMGLSLPALVAACRAVLAAAGSAGARASDPHSCDTAATTGSAAAQSDQPGEGQAGGETAAAAAVSARQWCQKLHLWPEQGAAWGDTDAAVAALLQELQALATRGAERDCSGGSGGGCDSSSGEMGGGAADAGAPAAATATVPAARGGPWRPCVPHLRHLLGLGRACHCGRGHVGVEALRAEVAERLRGSTGAQAVAWEAPEPARPQPRQQRQQDRSKRRRRRQEQAVGGAGGGDDGEESDSEGGSEAAMEGGDGGRSDGGGGGERVVLLVGNIPAAVKAAAVQSQLAAAFAPHGCRAVSVSRTRNGGCHGWARVTLAGPGAGGAAEAAVRRLDGVLRLGGAPLSVSHSSGRLDTIFPYLPYAVRSSLRVDATAAFSATDQASADKMTELLARLAERLLLRRLPDEQEQQEEELQGTQVQALRPNADATAAGPEAAVGACATRVPCDTAETAQGERGGAADAVAVVAGVSARGTSVTGSGEQQPGKRMRRQQQRERPRPDAAGQAAGAGVVSHQPPSQPRPPPRLLPLAVTDGTACCGGNTLSFARRFGRVVAVELDPERAGDLRHNAALVRAWASFRPGHHPAPPAPGATGSPPAMPEGCCDGPRPDVCSPSAQAPCTSNSGTEGGPASDANAEPGADGRLDASTDTRAPMGDIRVLCGDYTRLARSLTQDIVFMDPPWGGPQYGGSTGTGGGGGGASGGGGADAVLPADGRGKGVTSLGVVPAARGGGTDGGSDGGTAGATADGADPGDRAFTLGGVPLSRLVSELLWRGAARLVALKLPSRAAGELRALQARVAALVDSHLQRTAGDSRAGQGGSSRAGGERLRCACPPRLLGADVTLGRTALVVFVLPSCRAGPAQRTKQRTEQRGPRTEQRDTGMAGCAANGADGGEGIDVVVDATLTGKPEGRGEGEGPAQSGGAGAGHAETLGAVTGRIARGCTPLRAARVPTVGSCGCGCGRVGLAFRGTLRESCCELGLPYRVFCG